MQIYDRKKIVSDLCSELKTTMLVKERAIAILDIADKSGKLVYITEPSKIAAAVYISALLGSERRTQKEVCDQMGITLVTLGRTYRRMAETLDFDIIL